MTDNGAMFGGAMQIVKQKISEGVEINSKELEHYFYVMGLYVYLALENDGASVDFEPKDAMDMKWSATELYFKELKAAVEPVFAKYSQIFGIIIDSEWDGEDMYNKLWLVDHVEEDVDQSDIDFNDVDPIWQIMDTDLLESLRSHMGGQSAFWRDGTHGIR